MTSSATRPAPGGGGRAHDSVSAGISERDKTGVL
jgi:hypothetical protein